MLSRITNWLKRFFTPAVKLRTHIYIDPTPEDWENIRIQMEEAELRDRRNTIYRFDEAQYRLIREGLNPEAVDELFADEWPNDQDIIDWLNEEEVADAYWDNPRHLKYDPPHGF